MKREQTCQKDKCGEAFFQATKSVADEQEAYRENVKKEARERKQRNKAETNEKISALHQAGLTREARYLRADSIGFQYEEGELDSDEHPDSCEEFDIASDSSLVPPWCLDQSSSDDSSLD